ncbi:PilZ domain-containing protein [Deltaproteobacteria bacterium TL4]
MDISASRFQEQDEDTRWKLNTPIQIYIREDLPHLAGHTRDMSLSGINIEVGVKLPLKATITLEIFFQRDDVFEFIDQEALKIKGIVMWRKPLSDEEYDVWDTGLRFLELTEKQRSTILEEVETMEML